MNFGIYDIRKTMTKKALKELYKKKRAMNGFNTGERVFKNVKYPTRQQTKKIIFD